MLSLLQKPNAQEYASCDMEQSVSTCVSVQIQSPMITLTTVIPGVSIHHRKNGLWRMPIECMLAPAGGESAESVDLAHEANSRRPGICILLSGVHPQGTGPPRVSFKGRKGKEITTNMNTAEVHKATLRQVSSCYRVAWCQSSSKHSTLLHGLGMWEKLVTLGLPIGHRLSRLKSEHSTASQPPSSQLNHRRGQGSIQPE